MILGSTSQGSELQTKWTLRSLSKEPGLIVGQVLSLDLWFSWHPSQMELNGWLPEKHCKLDQEKLWVDTLWTSLSRDTKCVSRHKEHWVQCRKRARCTKDVKARIMPERTPTKRQGHETPSVCHYIKKQWVQCRKEGKMYEWCKGNRMPETNASLKARKRDTKCSVQCRQRPDVRMV